MASRTTPGTSDTSRMRRRHLVMGATQSSWSLTSWSSPMFLPMFPLGIWPAIIRTGEDAAYAVLRPAAALRRPGPGTTRAVPICPPARA